MIIDNVFYTEIQMENGSFNEFVQKGWYALKVHEIYPDEKINPDAFLDWARDIGWIEQVHIIIVVKGIIQEETRKEINFLSEYWEERHQNAKEPEDRKQVDFIIVS